MDSSLSAAAYGVPSGSPCVISVCDHAVLRPRSRPRRPEWNQLPESSRHNVLLFLPQTRCAKAVRASMVLVDTIDPRLNKVAANATELAGPLCSYDALRQGALAGLRRGSAEGVGGRGRACDARPTRKHARSCATRRCSSKDRGQPSVSRAASAAVARSAAARYVEGRCGAWHAGQGRELAPPVDPVRLLADRLCRGEA